MSTNATTITLTVTKPDGTTSTTVQVLPTKSANNWLRTILDNIRIDDIEHRAECDDYRMPNYASKTVEQAFAVLDRLRSML